VPALSASASAVPKTNGVANGHTNGAAHNGHANGNGNGHANGKDKKPAAPTDEDGDVDLDGAMEDELSDLDEMPDEAASGDADL
jgi:hypothetical protein